MPDTAAADTPLLCRGATLIANTTGGDIAWRIVTSQLIVKPRAFAFTLDRNRAILIFIATGRHVTRIPITTGPFGMPDAAGRILA